MNKKLITGFVRDRLCLTAFFFVNSLLLITFNYLLSNKRSELFYPLAMSCFVFCAMLACEWYRYYRFNSSLDKCIENPGYELQPSTMEQKHLARVVEALHNKYNRELGEKNLEAANRRRFLSQWVHNMKTPVSVIDLVLQRFQAGEVQPGQAIDEVGLENMRLKDQLDKVLNLLRLEEFSSDYIPGSSDIATSVKSVINCCRGQFIYNRIYPVLLSEAESSNVLTDRKWNEFMLEQLVSNAIKYSREEVTGEHKMQDTPGSKSVFFYFEKDDKTVTLCIRDEGVGIPEYDMARIFDPFFTGENGRRRRNSTGIGLYICSVIARKLGHRLQITSEEGMGTEVRITYLTKL